jgi:hypothetical protein
LYGDVLSRRRFVEETFCMCAHTLAFSILMLLLLSVIKYSTVHFLAFFNITQEFFAKMYLCSKRISEPVIQCHFEDRQSLKIVHKINHVTKCSAKVLLEIIGSRVCIFVLARVRSLQMVKLSTKNNS